MVFIIITTKLHTSCNSHPHLHRFVLMFSFLPSSSKVTAAVKTRLVGSRELLKTDAPCKLQQMILQVLKTAQNIQTNTDGTIFLQIWMTPPVASPQYHCARTAVTLCLQSIWFPSGTSTTPHCIINSTHSAESLNDSSSTTNATDNFIGLYLCNAEPTQQRHVT